MDAALDAARKVQVLDGVVLGKTEECDVIAAITDVEVYCMVVAVKCATIDDVAAPANAQVGSNVGKELGVHVTFATGFLHKVAEPFPISCRADAEDVGLIGLASCGGDWHDDVALLLPLATEFAQQVDLVGYYCIFLRMHHRHSLAVLNLPRIGCLTIHKVKHLVLVGLIIMVCVCPAVLGNSETAIVGSPGAPCAIIEYA